MAEIQKSAHAGETTAQFIEFVMMQAQNASLFLGLIPHPGSGEPEVNLDLARMFIDQLGMIQEKTRGNLTNEETAVLRNALSNLQMAFFEASQGKTAGAHPAAVEQPATAEPVQQPAAAAAAPGPAQGDEPPPAAEETGTRKRFTKSYGG